jgi:uncharacterized protein YecA (UPF0149 family)
MVREVLDRDEAYVKRLERHYKMVKAALADPEHPAHKSLPPKRTDEQEFGEAVGAWTRMAATTGRNDPCPCGAMANGKRKKFKRCCLVPIDRVGPPAESRPWTN